MTISKFSCEFQQDLSTMKTSTMNDLCYTIFSSMGVYSNKAYSMIRFFYLSTMHFGKGSTTWCDALYRFQSVILLCLYVCLA